METKRADSVTTKCPTCNEWLTPTPSGATCDLGHGGIFPGVTEKDIKSAKRGELKSLAETAFKAMPECHGLDINRNVSSGLYSIDNVPGIYRRVRSMSWWNASVAESINGGVFVRCTTYGGANRIWEMMRQDGLERRLKEAMGITT